jgi:hypothetical protein
VIHLCLLEFLAFNLNTAKLDRRLFIPKQQPLIVISQLIGTSEQDEAEDEEAEEEVVIMAGKLIRTSDQNREGRTRNLQTSSTTRR